MKFASVLLLTAVLAAPALVYCCRLNGTFRAPQKRQDKARRAGHGHSLVKRRNAVMALLGGSLRASP